MYLSARKTKHSLQPPDNRGFALLITIVLMAMLVLLMVSMAALTRVETQIAANYQKADQARANALVGLNIALGQLQKHVGPDQRVTARADILDATNVNTSSPTPSILATRSSTDTFGLADATEVTGLGGRPVYHNNNLLTGVWGNSAQSGAYTNTPQLLTWLVSGNEAASYTTLLTTPNFGRIDADGITPGPLSATSPFVPTSSNPAVQLVGPGTVGGGSSPTNAQKAQMVAALTVPLTAASNQIPGLPATTDPVTIGRYAYWVGDEGVKAKFNLPNAWANITNPADPQIRYRYQTAQSTGIDSMTDGTLNPDGTSTGDLIGSTAYNQTTDAGRDNITKAIALNSVQFSLGAANNTFGQTHFHDVTTYSKSVLSNVRDGGLKKDLTSAFAPGTTETTAPTGELWQIPSTTLGTPLGADMLATGVANFDGKGPTWQVLRSYAQLGSRVTGSGTTASMAPIAPAASTAPTQPTQMGVFPVVVGYQIYYSSEVIKVGTEYQVLLRHIPAVILWNPYNVSLDSATYAFQHSFDSHFAGAVFYARIQSGTSSGASVGFSANTQASSPYYYYQLGITAPSPTIRRYPLQFELNSGVMEPGRAYIYAMAADADTDDTRANPATYKSDPTKLPFTLVRGWSVGAINGVGIVARSPLFAQPPNLPAGSNYYATFGIGGSSSTVSQKNMPDPSNPADYGLKVGGSLPSNDLLIMRLGSDSGPDLQWLSNNISRTTNQQHRTLGTAFPTSPTAATTAASWGFKLNLKTTELDTKFVPTVTTNSWIPWLAGYNPRATNSFRSAYEVQLPGGNGYYNSNPSFGRVNSLNPTTNPANLEPNYSINESGGFFPFPYASGSQPTVLFDVPRPGQALQSIAALQHADINRYLFQPKLVANTYSLRLANNFAPCYPIGNSMVDMRVGLSTDPYGQLTRAAGNNITGSQPAWFFDQSYLANHALWDNYYFSTVPSTGSVAFPLPNGRQVLATTAQGDDTTVLRDTDQSASRLMVDGGFNINSTSVEAWRAVLASTLNTPVGSKALPNKVPVPRLVYPVDDANEMDQTSFAENEPNSFAGYRTLTPAQISALATAVVAQVKARGPFVSMADFVNRALVDPTSTNGTANDKRNAGALHAAIAATTINSSFTNTGTDIVSLPVPGAGFSSYNAVPDSTIPVPLSTNSPGWVTQADLLQVLGPVLTARSDTFVVRVYGEVLNPLDSTQVQARAWAEAIVQRTPAYLVPSSTDDGNGADGDAAWANWTSNLNNSDNKNFGRRLKIISFRWLSPSDI